MILMLCAALVCGTSMPDSASAKIIKPRHMVDSYARLVYFSYRKAYDDAAYLQETVERLIENPSRSRLRQAREAWRAARDSYNQTEVFRFYNGPIDYRHQGNESTGPEHYLNAWPVDPDRIDDPHHGILYKPVEIDKKSLQVIHQKGDLADIYTGYHVVEYLLWGRDQPGNHMGDVPYTNFLGRNDVSERRVILLEEVMQLIIDDMRFLIFSWVDDEPNNYAASFRQRDEGETIASIFSGMVNLAGYELAEARLRHMLEAKDTLEEPATFSDHTKRELEMSMQGIYNVYHGEHPGFDGLSWHQYVKKRDLTAALKTHEALIEAKQAIRDIPGPLDIEVIASEKDSLGRQKVREAITALKTLSRALLKAAGAAGSKPITVIRPAR